MVQARGIDRQFLSGLTIIVLLAAVVVGTLMQYNGVFRPSVDVVVEADRAGITMAPGAPVKLYGVEVGAVSDVDIDGDRAEITLELEPDQADSVPRDVTAQLVPPTAFGAKYVQLTVPEGASSESIEAGDVIPASVTTVEVDEAFTNLSAVLEAARPAQVSEALSAVAGTVDQRGEMLESSSP